MPEVIRNPHDPSPSRIKYRLERVWLTPFYRSMIRTGVPVALFVALVANYFADPGTRSKIAFSVTNAWKMVEERPEFAVNLMRVSGATTDVAEQIREVAPIVFPISSMRLELDSIKARIEAVDAVERADVFLRSGVLDVQIQERAPVLVWRDADQVELVDAHGVRAGLVESRDVRTDLPLVIGKGGQAQAKVAMDILAVSGPIAARVRALRWVGERRWDVLLDRNQIIQLPVQDPIQALERVIALNSARDLLSRDITVVDMRDGRRPVVRLTTVAMDELLRLRAINDGDSE